MSVERAVNDLLARIHRDGGHYVAEHGVEKAARDAEEVVVRERQEREELVGALRRIATEDFDDLDVDDGWVHKSARALAWRALEKAEVER